MSSDTYGFLSDIEAQVLGLILSGGARPAVFGMLSEDHFVDPFHREVYRASRVARERFSSTMLPVVVKLIDPEAAKKFEAGTGVRLAEYLARATSSTLFTSATCTQAAKNVILQWGRIKLAQEMAVLQTAASAPDADVIALLREISERVDEVSVEVRRGSKAKSRLPMKDAMGEMLSVMREAKARQGLTGITTGLLDLDRATGGLQRRDLVLLGARPSMGKTSLATSIAYSAANAGHGVGILSLEMDRPKLMARIASDVMHRGGVHVPYIDLVSATADDEAVAAMLSKVSQPLWIDDQPGLSISDIRGKVEAMAGEAEQAGFALDLLIVDHLGKVRPTSRYAGNRVNEIAEITEGLKELAREYDLSVLLLTQLNRAVEQRDDKRPTLADLRDSGAIEQDADVVLLLYRESYYLQRQKPATAADAMTRDEKLAACQFAAELEIAKQRNGVVKTLDLWCDVKFSAFRNAVQYGRYSEAA